jgi:hypothetical protein
MANGHFTELAASEPALCYLKIKDAGAGMTNVFRAAVAPTSVQLAQ